jgi:hypothetical protein
MRNEENIGLKRRQEEEQARTGRRPLGMPSAWILRLVLCSVVGCVSGSTALQGQALYDLVTGPRGATFRTRGPSENSYTLEFRMRAKANVRPMLTGAALLCATHPSAPLLFACLDGSEQNPSGNPNFTMQAGEDYRFRFQHDYANSKITLTIWSGSCTALYSRSYPVINPHALDMNTTWQMAGNQRISFLRLYTGTNASNACPVDAPADSANLFDFAFENTSGTLGSLVDRSNGYTISAPGSGFTPSASYNPRTAIAWSGPPKNVWKANTEFMLRSSAITFTWPGTGAPASYSWSQTAGPGTCTLSGSDVVRASCDQPGEYTLQLAVTDKAGNTATATTAAGIVATDNNGCVVIASETYKDALANKKCLPVMGSTSAPWFEATEAADVDLLSAPLAAPIHMVAGPGTVTIPAGPNQLNLLVENSITSSGKTVNGVGYRGVAVQGTGTDFTMADVGSYVEITWDADRDGSFQGHFVGFVLNVDPVNQVLVLAAYNLMNPPDAFAKGLSWHRLGVGSGSCSSLDATVSGGQVTGIAGAETCSGFYWWATRTPVVSLTLDGASGCNVTATIYGPNTTTDQSIWGTVQGFSGLPCGTGFTSAPTVAIVPFTDYGPYDITQGGGYIFNYYEAILAIGRLAARTNLSVYQTAWHNGCANAWRWSSDSGYFHAAIPRNGGWDMLLACATDPSWTPPGGAVSWFAGVARLVRDECVYNPTADVLQGQLDGREESYCARAAAKLAKLGNTYGGIGTQWCSYLANQVSHRWLPGSTSPIGDTTGAAYIPEDLFIVNQNYPAAANPPGSTRFGTSPWRSAGLPAIALSDAYEALQQCGNPQLAADTLKLVQGLATFIANYGMAPDGGTFYDVGYASNPNSPLLTWNDYIPAGSRQSGAITVTSGSNTVTGTAGDSYYGRVNFSRRFWPGASMQINGKTYTVDTVPGVAGGNDTLTLTTNYTGASGLTTNFGNTCAMTVTHGSATVSGSPSCRFMTLFGGGNAYVGILSAGCAAGVPPCQTTDATTYAITPDTDTTATLNTAFIGCASGCAGAGGTSGTYTSFVYVPQTQTNCGASMAVFCDPDPYNGRNLSQDVCYPFAWMYAQTGLPGPPKRGTA